MFDLQKVKQDLISSTINFVYELAHSFQTTYDLGSWETRKYQESFEVFSFLSRNKALVIWT